MKFLIPTSVALLALTLSGCSTYHRFVDYFSSSSSSVPYAKQAELDQHIKGCEHQQGEACLAAGTMYELRGKPFYSQALRYYQLGTGLKQPAAYSALGHMFENGYAIPQDLTRARELYQQGAELGDATSYLYLSNLYRYGRGIDKNLPKARQYATLACKKGNVMACSAQNQIKK
ncbi:sel1 repeat family protein [Rosenbergiella sp. S61]|uniref:Sel1 repeat family protein n=1 Tax=Rosenbergiella gaditana TaxID=2726987 RepID=A0ABS5SZ94_9GAMM|nr:tetratricopeptide repeat protein [Rosenbergiella gaditana]MBT0725232.1 sel1 repeat family protein [Rosenbergiella gaditana]